MKLRIALILVLTIVCALVVACAAAASGGSDRAAFDSQYQAYKQSCETWCQDHQGASWRYPGKELTEMGPSGVPFLVEKMAKGEDTQLFPREHIAMCSITKKRFSPSEISEAAKNHALPEMWVRWWNEDRAKTPEKFAALYAQMQTPDPSGARIAIRDMGVDVLPLVMDKISAGDEKMVPVVSEIMGKEVGSTPAAVLDWWKANQAKVELPEAK